MTIRTAFFSVLIAAFKGAAISMLKIDSKLMVGAEGGTRGQRVIADVGSGAQ